MSISQSRFVCQVWCSSIQGIYSQLPRGSICQSMFICQVLCTGIQGKYHLSELNSLIVIWGVFWGWQGGYIWHDCTMLTDCLLPQLFRNKRKFPPFLEESICQSRFICQVWCSSIQGIYAWFTGGCLSATVCSSATFCVLVFKANITCQSWNLLLSFGGYFGGVLRGVTYDMTVQC